MSRGMAGPQAVMAEQRLDFFSTGAAARAGACLPAPDCLLVAAYLVLSDPHNVVRIELVQHRPISHPADHGSMIHASFDEILGADSVIE